MTRIEEIEAREAKATKGPWIQDIGGDCVFAFIEGEDDIEIAKLNADYGADADGQFIAHAREDIPYLLSENKRMREALENMKNWTKNMRESHKLVGPTEYQNKPALMKAWAKTRYHDGKALYEIIRAALKSKE